MTSPILICKPIRGIYWENADSDSVSLGRSLSFYISSHLREMLVVVVPDPHSSMVFTKFCCSCFSALMALKEKSPLLVFSVVFQKETNS